MRLASFKHCNKNEWTITNSAILYKIIGNTFNARGSVFLCKFSKWRNTSEAIEFIS